MPSYAELAKIRVERRHALAARPSRLGEKHASVETQLRAHAELTQHLASTTQGLREALANPKARGQWGERMADDILRHAGFVEHVTWETG